MNLKWGGKQSLMHASLIDPEFATTILGDQPAVLKAGDTQHFVFRECDPPPWYAPETPPYNIVTKTTKRDADGTERTVETVTAEGYVGKAKGSKQVLWEVGKWRMGRLKGDGD